MQRRLTFGHGKPEAAAVAAAADPPAASPPAPAAAPDPTGAATNAVGGGGRSGEVSRQTDDLHDLSPRHGLDVSGRIG